MCIALIVAQVLKIRIVVACLRSTWVGRHFMITASSSVLARTASDDSRTTPAPSPTTRNPLIANFPSLNRCATFHATSLTLQTPSSRSQMRSLNRTRPTSRSIDDAYAAVRCPRAASSARATGVRRSCETSADRRLVLATRDGCDGARGGDGVWVGLLVGCGVLPGHVVVAVSLG
jgi:hypothetical protein